jgi:pimeloyl-ACP methyl ester carboxylesterase
MDVISNAGHFPHWEQPRGFTDRISRFVDTN